MLTNQVTRWFDRLIQQDLEEGALAYPRYKEVMADFASHWGFGLVPTVEAFVALSPNNDYFGNLRSLSSVMKHVKDGEPFTVSTYRGCAERAISYLNGSVSFLDTVGGQKIISFRDNILYPDTSRRFTVDGHMIAIALGNDRTTMKDAAFMMKGKSHYLQVEDFYVRFARSKGMIPNQMQAALWFCRKRILEIKASNQVDLFREELDQNQTLVRPEDAPPYEWREVEPTTSHDLELEVMRDLFDA